jgi:hypothetical protein
MRPLRVATGALAVVLLGLSAPAAQSPAVLGNLGIDLWPDYDRPGLLVIYRATIAPETPLPAQLVFRIPAAAGAPNAVAERAADDRLVTLPYDRTVDGGTALIAFTASRPYVQLEYYDPAITREGPEHRFAFTWPGDFEVRDFSISLQQPHLSQNFTTVPEAASAATSADGLTYHTLVRTGTKVGETVGVEASYEKASDRLSAETLPPAATPTPAPATGNVPVPALPTESATTSYSPTMLVVVAAMFACAAAAIVIALMSQSRQTGSAPALTPPSRAASSKVSGKKAARFCTQCGAGIGAGDRFCQRCGSALRP